MNMNQRADFSNSIRPCPFCKTRMTLRQVSAPGDYGTRRWFYFLYCNECGSGPLQAFDTTTAAIVHWNDNALTKMRSSYSRII